MAALELQAGDTLVVIPPTPMPMGTQRRLIEFAQEQGVSIIVLPHGSQVYVRSSP